LASKKKANAARVSPLISLRSPRYARLQTCLQPRTFFNNFLEFKSTSKSLCPRNAPE